MDEEDAGTGLVISLILIALLVGFIWLSGGFDDKPKENKLSLYDTIQTNDSTFVIKKSKITFDTIQTNDSTFVIRPKT